jgi:DNA modification methylase
MILTGDVIEMLQTIPDRSVRCCVTSPPYWGLRDYGVQGQIGLEDTPEKYVAKMVEVFEEVSRVLTDDGTLWLNLGDSYAASGMGGGGAKQSTNTGSRIKGHKAPDGLKPKDLIGMPWRVAFALQAAGWWLRSDIVWAKPNPMPESVTDRPTRSHEYIFLITKSARYYYDADAIKELATSETTKMPDGWDTATGSHGTIHRNGHEKGKPSTDKQSGHGRRHAGFNDRYASMSKEEQSSFMRNKRDVWIVPSQPFSEAHFATFPENLIKPCILAGTAPGDTVLDPFFGSGTTGVVAQSMGRKYVGIELNPEYVKIAEKRLDKTNLGLGV